jgi:Tfp pilus assembly protein PilV
MRKTGRIGRPPTDGSRGFTVVEVMVAIVILTTGIFALAGASAIVTRTIGGAKWQTTASEVARQRLDMLRMAANSTPGALCTSLQFTSSPAPVITQGIQETWQVPPTGIMRTVRVITSYRAAGRARVDTLSSRISCF